MPMRDGRETPEEYAARQRHNEERAREREERQRLYAERQRDNERKHQEWQARQREKEQRQREYEQQRESNRAAKQAIIREAQSWADSTDWKEGGAAMRRLLEAWKAVTPYRQEDENKSLWSNFDNARQTFFGRQKAFFAQRDEQKRIGKAKNKI